MGILLLHLHAEESNLIKDPIIPVNLETKGNKTIDLAVNLKHNETIKLNQKELQKNILYLRIHKVMPGDPYYGIFNGNETEARRYSNMIWRRLFARYKNYTY
ncbi:uncharacterized protein Dwil_GK28191 [Drosophila willistoni]|nr:uncharacterized protein Dwil_GK28191 [Drosophila willistoni]